MGRDCFSLFHILDYRDECGWWIKSSAACPLFSFLLQLTEQASQFQMHNFGISNVITAYGTGVTREGCGESPPVPSTCVPVEI